MKSSTKDKVKGAFHEAKGKAGKWSGKSASDRVASHVRTGARPIYCRTSVYDTMVNWAALDPWEKGGDGLGNIIDRT